MCADCFLVMPKEQLQRGAACGGERRSHGAAESRPVLAVGPLGLRTGTAVWGLACVSYRPRGLGFD